MGDVALLRAAGEQISATPRGYVLKQEQNLQTRTIACRHDDEHLLQELYIAVDNGCAVLDVTVEHPIYGQISGQLQVFSRYDADQFYHKLTTTNAPPLCALTGGVHLHTIQFQHEEDFERWSAACGRRASSFPSSPIPLPAQSPSRAAVPLRARTPRARRRSAPLQRSCPDRG